MGSLQRDSGGIAGSFGRRTSTHLIAMTLGLCIPTGCRSKQPEPQAAAPSFTLELVDIDSARSRRGARPLIAGEDLRIVFRVDGGEAPYSLQVFTAKGDPRFASGDVELADTSGHFESAMALATDSQVASGTYVLGARVSDAQGRGATVSSAGVEVVGSDAPLLAPSQKPPFLRVEDIAGRKRAAFYQGEVVRIRGELTAPHPFAIALVASDDRPFMPAQRFAASDRIDLTLQIPGLARVGQYRVDFAAEGNDELSASQVFAVEGRSFAPADKLALADLGMYGGDDLRTPMTALLPRGTTVAAEAIAAGVKTRARVQWRLRDRSTRIVAKGEGDDIVPIDTAAEARWFARASVPLPAELPRGRYMFELEIVEGDDISTLYRELELE